MRNLFTKTRYTHVPFWLLISGKLSQNQGSEHSEMKWLSEKERQVNKKLLTDQVSPPCGALAWQNGMAGGSPGSGGPGRGIVGGCANGGPGTLETYRNQTENSEALASQKTKAWNITTHVKSKMLADIRPPRPNVVVPTDKRMSQLHYKYQIISTSIARQLTLANCDDHRGVSGLVPLLDCILSKKEDNFSVHYYT